MIAVFAAPDKVHALMTGPAEDGFARLSGETGLVEAIGLEARFSDPDMWKADLRAMLAGNEVSGPEMHTLLYQLILQSAAGPEDTEATGSPFTDLDHAASYLQAAGHDEAARFIRAIYDGDLGPSSARLPERLQVGPGRASYPSAISYFSAADATAFLAELPVIAAAAEEISAYVRDEADEAAERAHTAIGKAARAKAEAFFASNPGYLEGRSLEEAVDDSVRQDLADPYLYSQSADELVAHLDLIRRWLERASSSGTGVFFIYEVY